MMRSKPTLLLAGLLLTVVASGANAKSFKICDDVREPSALDPLKAFDDKTHNLLQQIFDCLVQFDPDGQLQPALAVSWERIDPLTMRFHLRPGVQFHNGEPFDAEAVRLTLERHLDPKTQFPGLGFIGIIKGAKVVDPLTVDIMTHVPDSLLLRRLAGFIFVLPPKAYMDSDFGSHPSGTGPYKFKTWTKGSSIELERNAGHWEKRDSSPGELSFSFVTADKQVGMLLKGELDMITDLPGTFTYQVASNANTKVIKKKTFYTAIGNFNTGRGPLKDVRVRRAINYAVNKDELIRYDVLGNGAVIAGLSMPGEIGHDPGLKPFAYNPEKAKALLAEAGVKLPIKLKAVTKIQGDRTAKVFKENLQKVGIELDISDVAGGADVVKAMAAKDMDLGITSFPDIMGHIFFLQSISLYSRSPFSLYNNPDFDRRLEAMVSELDPSKHEKMAQELDRFVQEEALCIFTYQQIRTYGVSKKVDFNPSVTSRLYCNRINIKGDAHP